MKGIHKILFHPYAGTHIKEAIETGKELSKTLSCIVTLSFNGVELAIHNDVSMEEHMELWDKLKTVSNIKELKTE